MRKTYFFCLCGVFIFILVFCGCIKQESEKIYTEKNTLEYKMRSLSLGMSKQEVIEIIGEPKVVRGSFIDSSKRVIEVLEYRPYLFIIYWFYFCDGKLLKWGRPGDWDRKADSISEIRFR